jgi:hypothetical protein
VLDVEVELVEVEEEDEEEAAAPPAPEVAAADESAGVEPQPIEMRRGNARGAARRAS